jgi:acetoin utilization deacetylase AcuC-like enzyme
MILITSPRFEEHVTPPGHPERPERAHVFDVVAARWLERGGRSTAPRLAERQELERVHDAEYVGMVLGTAGRAMMLDADTFTSPESVEIARLAAGAAIQAAVHAVEQREPAFALVRPPGHHAERDKAMGFCLFNNVAVAAAALLDRGLSRIAIVDIDVHHGNGTQWFFYDDPRVLYVSSHQHPFYPGTGAADEVGTGDGRGFTVNVPLEAGATDGDYEVAYDRIVLPILDQFSPEVVLISAGFDAHERDPLASMRVSVRGYATVVKSLADAAAGHGRLALVTEGGYELPALASCLEASIIAIDAGSLPAEAGASPTEATGRGERGADAARHSVAPFWRGI